MCVCLCVSVCACFYVFVGVSCLSPLGFKNKSMYSYSLVPSVSSTVNHGICSNFRSKGAGTLCE
jgi:hypothetical protein